MVQCLQLASMLLGLYRSATPTPRPGCFFCPCSTRYPFNPGPSLCLSQIQFFSFYCVFTLIPDYVHVMLSPLSHFRPCKEKLPLSLQFLYTAPAPAAASAILAFLLIPNTFAPAHPPSTLAALRASGSSTRGMRPAAHGLSHGTSCKCTCCRRVLRVFIIWVVKCPSKNHPHNQYQDNTI